jgi:hypothetical protein
MTLCCVVSTPFETAWAATDGGSADTNSAQLVPAMAMARNGEKRNLGVIERYAITSAAGITFRQSNVSVEMTDA